MNTTRSEREWPDEFVRWMQLIGQIFANALARKRADQALRESELRLNLAADSAEAGLWELDLHTQNFWASDQARHLFGYSPQECVDLERFRASVHPDDWERVQQSLEQSQRPGERLNVEYRIRHGDGSERWIASRGRAIFNPAGEPDRLLGLSLDITERKQTEAALRASEARLAAGTDLAGLGYFEVDYDQGHCFFDNRFRDICGVPADVQQGLEPIQFWLQHVHADDLQFVSQERQKLQGGLVDQIVGEYRYQHPARGLRWLQHSARLAGRGAGGIRTYGVIRDITEQKQAELEAQELRSSLAHAGRVSLLGQLASALAHELSQPLGAILRNAEAAEILLREPSPDLEEIRAIVTDIHADDQRAGQVIDHLRSLLKRRSLDPQPMDLQAVIAEVLSLIQSDANARQVKLGFSPVPGLPMVLGDRIHLQQVLLNLLVNAMDALEGCAPAQRCVQVSTHRADPRNVEVRVCDSGPGIPGESLERLFEPFFSTKAKGMGLGLPMSKTIIEAHQGKIWAGNRPEGGACFCFTVPTERAKGQGASDRRGNK